MAYIGNVPPSFFTSVAVDVFSGNSSNTAFTLSKPITSTTDIEVVVDNIQQNPFSGSYSINGTTLTFSSAPASGSNNVVVAYRQATIGSTIASANSVSSSSLQPNSVSSSSLQPNLTLSGNLSVSSNTVTFGTSFYSIANGNVGVGTASPLTRLHINNSTNGAENFIRIHDGDATYGSAIGLGTLGDLVVSRYNGGAATEALRVTRDGGRFTLASQPFFYAGRNTDQTGYNSSSTGDVVVLYNTTTTNIGNHFNTSTGKFVAPVAGNYIFHASAYSAATTFQQNFLVFNGSRISGTDWVHAFSNMSTGFWIIRLAANDTIGFHAYNASVTNATINSNQEHTYFKGYLLS